MGSNENDPGINLMLTIPLGGGGGVFVRGSLGGRNTNRAVVRVWTMYY